MNEIEVLELPSLDLAIFQVPKSGSTFFHRFASQSNPLVPSSQSKMSNLAIPMRDPVSRLRSGIVEVFFRWAPSPIHGAFQIHYPIDPYMGLRKADLVHSPVQSTGKALLHVGFFDKHLEPVSNLIARSGRYFQRTLIFDLHRSPELLALAGLGDASAPVPNSWIHPSEDRDDELQSIRHLAMRPGLLRDRTMIYSLRNPLVGLPPAKGWAVVLRKVARRKAQNLARTLNTDPTSVQHMRDVVMAHYEDDSHLWLQVKNVGNGLLSDITGS